MKKTLDANQLKLIAIFAMTVDHIAWLLFPGYAVAARARWQTARVPCQI